MTPNMSFTWRSILGARKVIEKGDRRVIGNGATTSIWGDAWCKIYLALKSFRGLMMGKRLLSLLKNYEGKDNGIVRCWGFYSLK